MLKIYHVRGTRSVRPIWLAYELGLQVEVEPIDFSPSFRNSPGWRAISPAGKVPAMSDGQLTMFESGAIVDYILERYGEGRLRPPPGTPASAIYHQWCWFSEATLLRPLGLNRLLRQKPGDAEGLVAEAEQKARLCLQVVDEAVADRAFLLGAEFGAADVMMGYALHALGQLGMLDGSHANARRYLQRLQGREAFLRALEIDASG